MSQKKNVSSDAPADPYASIPFTLEKLDRLRRTLADAQANADHLREIVEFHGVVMGHARGWRERAAAAEVREPQERAAAQEAQARVGKMRDKLAAYEAEFDRRAGRAL